MKLFFAVILSFFALFGIIQMFMGVLRTFRRKNMHKTLFWHTVVCIKDNEDIIEGILRSYGYDGCDNLIVLDGGSSDEGAEIVKRFAEENEFVHFMQPEEYSGFLNRSLCREK